MQLDAFVVAQTKLPITYVRNTLKLLADGATVPFIARYRKEQTGNFDEVQIDDIVKSKEQFEHIEKRKQSILNAIEQQDALTPDLQAKIKDTYDIVALEDIYLPYKKSRKTKAETAIKQGLEPLAKIIMSQRNFISDIALEKQASSFIKGDIKSINQALEGARFIIAEWINERTDIRNDMRFQLKRFAAITTKVVKTKKEEPSAQKYRDYFKWSEPLNRIPSHRLLAILRAEHEGFIRLKIEIDDEKALQKIEKRIVKGHDACAQQIKLAIKDSYKRLLYPSLSNEKLQEAKSKAEEEAIQVFAKNLQQLLLGSPLGEKRVLAIDPGFRTGCKVVCIDAQGSLLHDTVIYPHAPQNKVAAAEETISHLIEKYKMEAIAIGNGTASRETEHLVKSIAVAKSIDYFIVNEAGASIYSASKIAREEFPDYDVTVRGAVSIGRRLQDPLAELVKIDAKSIGVGQYQHDVNQTKLKNELDKEVVSAVNAVGVNINTASKSLLSYVSGIGEGLAENIIKYRDKEGVFLSRNDIKKVSRLGDKAFEQSAAFLRIKGAKNPLDDSAVHPERYNLVKRIAKDVSLSVKELIGNKTVLHKIDLQKYCTSDVGLPTLQDIRKELEKPGLDIREQAKAFSFDENIQTIEDVAKGQVLPGIVNNITNFGAFVDIGIKESGLIHISNLADTFVSDVNQHVSLQQKVSVKVLEVDKARKRIQLQLYKA